jgi:hypothetical protein
MQKAAVAVLEPVRPPALVLAKRDECGCAGADAAAAANATAATAVAANLTAAAAATAMASGVVLSFNTHIWS